MTLDWHIRKLYVGGGHRCVAEAVVLTGNVCVFDGVGPHVGVYGGLAVLVHNQPVEPDDAVVVGVGVDGDPIDDH